MKLLSFERSCAAAIFDTVLPLGGPDGLPVAPDIHSRFAAELVATAPAHVAWGLRACTWLVQFSPPLLLGRPSTFVGLSVEHRVRLLTRLSHSRLFLLRELPLFFKMTAALGAGGLPATHRALGISPTDAQPPSWSRRGLPMVKAGGGAP